MRSIFRLVTDSSAAVAVQIALTAVVLMGFVGLAIELGEAFALNTELQEAADSAALSAAAELDGFAGAISRATTATTAFGPNKEEWDIGGPATVQIASETFLSATACGSPPCTPGSSLLLPPDPSPTGDVAATTDVEAAYVRVVTKTNSVSANLASLLTGRSLIKTQAVATAGRNAIVCLDVPLMICNPSEVDGNGDLPPSLVAGQEILVTDGGGTMIHPGDWGFLCPPSNPSCGAGDSGTWLASASSTATQCNSAIMNTKPGVNTGPITKSYNYRFAQNLPAPAGAQIAFNTVSYPADPALTSSSRLSNSTSASWDPGAAGGYWATAHPGVSYPPLGLTKSGPGNTATRFDVYNWENSTGDSTTNPPCSIPAGSYNPNGTQTIATNTARVMNIGIANCIAENEKGRWHGPGISYFQAFLTAPLTTSNIYLEVIKQYTFGSSGSVHNNVALYR